MVQLTRVTLLVLATQLLVSLVAHAGDSSPQPGDLIFSELLIDSSAASEWIELFNTSTSELDLSGCILEEEGDQVSLSGISVAPQAFVLLSSDTACVVFDEAGDCQRPSDLDYGLITLNNLDAVRLSLSCAGVLIDEVVYDNQVFAAQCSDLGSGTCSVGLSPQQMDASANDDWEGNWCLSPATAFVYDELGLESLSTPGAVNECQSPADSCGPGDLLFTELMIDPPDSSDSLEWLELLVTGPGGCDLHGCVLQEGPFAEINAENVAHEDWSSHIINGAGNALFLATGHYALLAKGSSDSVASALDGSQQMVADYNYSGISLANSELGYLHLLCGGQVVDSVPYDWQSFKPACLGTSCSLNLFAGNEDPQGNDELSSWCLPPLDQVWLAGDGESTMQASPGSAGACQQRNWPAADELIFTELMVSPHRSSAAESPQFAEWFELYNPGAEELELSGCRLVRERYDDLGELIPDNTQSVFLGTELSAPVLQAGEARVFSKGCLLSGDDPADEEAVACAEDEYTYTTVSLTDSTTESLSLRCPDGAAGELLIDKAGYDMTRTGLRKGRTLQFDPSSNEDNADPFQWCEASLLQDIPALFTLDGEHNYGTPGEVGPCASGQLDLPASGPGCRCTAGPGEPPALTFAALLATLLLRRPRRRRG